MAIDAKMSFMSQLSAGMAGTLTVEQMEKLNRSVMDILGRFEMYETARDDTVDDMLDSYLAALQVECRSQKTIERYRYEISRMMAFANVPTRRISVYHLRNYLAQEKSRGVSDSTLESQRQIFGAYFNWLQRESLIEKNPTANLGAIKCAKKEKKSYTAIEIEKLNQSAKTIRDRAILNFLGSTGCRISEMTGLNREDINFEKLECIVHGKGNKERTVYLSEVCGMLLRQYLSERKDSSEALFVGLRGERLQPGGVRAMLKELAGRANVEHCHPHKFRRTLATELTRHGMQVQEVARILGHEKLDTTMRYVVLNKDDIKASYRRYA